MVFSAAGTLGKLGLTAGSTRAEQKRALRWAMLASYLPEDVKSIERSFVRHAEYTLAQVRTSLTQQGAYQALSLSVRDRLIERWKDTQLYFQEKGCKRVAYMSMEFLLGRSLQNAIVNLGLEDNYSQAMMNLGMSLEDLYDEVRFLSVNAILVSNTPFLRKKTPVSETVVSEDSLRAFWTLSPL